MVDTAKVGAGSDADMRRSQRGVTRSSIAAAALELFLEQGYEGASVRDLGARLDVTASALYHHFRDKSEILDVIVSPLLDALERLIADVDEGPWSPALVRRRVEALYEVLASNRRVLTLLATDVSVAAHPLVVSRTSDMPDRLSSLLIPADATTDHRLRARASIGALVTPLTTSTEDELAECHDVLVRAALAVLGVRPGAAQRSERG